jgi:hypothetical protein
MFKLLFLDAMKILGLIEEKTEIVLKAVENIFTKWLLTRFMVNIYMNFNFETLN